MTAAIVSRKDQSILFGPNNGSVSRILHGHDNTVPSWYVASRGAIYANIPGPTFRVLIDQRTIEEEYVQGTNLVDLSVDEQVWRIQQLAVQHRPLVSGEHAVQVPKLVQRAIGGREGDCRVVDGAVHSRLPRLWSVPGVLSHGDLWIGNVIVAPRHAGCVAIDWEPSRIGIAPYWYDLVTLILGRYRAPAREAIQAFWNGRFDSALRALASNWGRAGNELTRNRSELVESWIALNVPQWTSEVNLWSERVRDSIVL